MSLFTSDHCCLFTINLSSLSFYTELKPSDAGLQGILSIAPLWHELAVSLGVPFLTVKANMQSPLGGMECLSYWRDGCCGEAYPHTWRFLLKTVKDSPTFGPLVAETIEKKAYSETSWSVLPAQLPGPSTLKVSLTTDPILKRNPFFLRFLFLGLELEVSECLQCILYIPLMCLKEAIV